MKTRRSMGSMVTSRYAVSALCFVSLRRSWSACEDLRRSCRPAGMAIVSGPAWTLRSTGPAAGAVLHALDLALQDAELDRVALIVGGVDRQNARLDLLQTRRRVVVARGV